jgi:hypothetical protein
LVKTIIFIQNQVHRVDTVFEINFAVIKIDF